MLNGKVSLPHHPISQLRKKDFTFCSIWRTYVHEKAAKEMFTEADTASAWMKTNKN